MKIYFEEIVKAHPAAKAPNQFRRKRGQQPVKCDEVASKLMVDGDLWFRHGGNFIKMHVILTRVAVVEDEVCTIIDICESALLEEIITSARGTYTFSRERYIQWATDNRVWP